MTPRSFPLPLFEAYTTRFLRFFTCPLATLLESERCVEYVNPSERPPYIIQTLQWALRLQVPRVCESSRNNLRSTINDRHHVGALQVDCVEYPTEGQSPRRRTCVCVWFSVSVEVLYLFDVDSYPRRAICIRRFYNTKILVDPLCESEPLSARNDCYSPDIRQGYFSSRTDSLKH